MDSYADIAAANAPPPEQQPHPDPALLTTPSVLGGASPDIATKVSVLRPNHEESSTYTKSESPRQVSETTTTKESRSKRSEIPTLCRWGKVKEVILQPSLASGLVGSVNIGLLAGTSYAFYTQPKLRRDTKVITSAMAAAVALLGIESYTINACRGPPEGSVARRNDAEGGSVLPFVGNACEHVPRPRIFEGTTGIVNASILGIVGYFAYRNCDRRIVFATSIGFITLLGGEFCYFSFDDIKRYFTSKS